MIPEPGVLEENAESLQPTDHQTMQAIESRYGEPGTRHAAVGEPPITRWDYQDYSVYFEYDRVLFSVLHRGKVIERG